MVQPLRRRPLPNICHPACPERSRGERSERSTFLSSLSPSSSEFFATSMLRKHRPFTDTVPPAALATSHSLLATIPFRIIFFAHPHHLTFSESYSYKKQGRGWVSRRTSPTQTVPFFSAAAQCATRRKCRKPITFMRLLHNLRTPRVGVPLALRCSAHSASLRYPFPLLASPLCVNAGGPNEP
jgi:hypothetical protein